MVRTEKIRQSCALGETLRRVGFRRSLLTVLVAMAPVSLHARQASFELEGRVVRVVDGDTVDILGDGNLLTRIRLANIDAPEKSMPFGRRSTENLAAMVAGQQVNAACLYREHRHNKSKADQRAVCTIYASIEGKQTDINWRQIHDGFAWYAFGFAAQQTPRVRETYAQAEQAAKTSRRGLWIDPNPMAPWDYRDLQR